MKKSSVSEMTQVALFSAIVVALAMIPGIGYIPLGITRATTIHIPVILASILLGPKKGALVGGVFGLTSLFTNTFSPTLTSFVFSPFYAGGNVLSLVICFVPRILTGVVPYYVYTLLSKKQAGNVPALALSGFLGSMTNTLLVMNMIYLFFGKSYAAAKNITVGLYDVILGVICVNGALEAVVAAVLITGLCKALIPYLKRNLKPVKSL
ncbi:MAG: ECF transporter S component [Oscillospiraceae bacterium]